MIKIETWGTLEALAEKADFLDGFFKVLMQLVEKSNFPIFFNDFYSDGNVQVDKLTTLLIEIKEIEKQLKTIPVDESYIINEPDFLKVVNYKKFLNSKATNMAEYFLTPNKENMFETFKYNIEYAIKKNAPVLIKYYSL